MAQTAASLMNGLTREGTHPPVPRCSTRACAVLVLGSVLTAFLTGCATAGGPRRVDDRVMPATWPWSRVGELEPGAQIAVATTSAPLRARIFVSADASEVTVLSLEVPSLPPAAIHALRDMATRHTKYFAAMQGGGSFEQGRVRLGRDGLFVADRRIAAFAQVVETLPRAAVREIRGPVVARGSVLGAIIGGWLGFSAGVVPALGGADAGVALTYLAGTTTLGSWLGQRWSNHTVEGLVYRAP
jgi:hypothetical protein